MRRNVSVDDDMGHRELETGLCPLNDTPLEPIRPLSRVRCDDDLVRGEADEGVLKGKDRVCICDLTPRM